MRIDVTIVVPAYNEADRLGRLLTELRTRRNADTTEVIVVDDGSTDTTAADAQRLLAPFPHSSVLRLMPNRGKGAALRHGIAMASGASVVTMDADMATDLSCLDALLATLDTADVAIGSRSLPDSVVHNGSPTRRLMGQTFNVILRTLTRVRVADSQCGFKAFRAPAARQLHELSVIDRYGQDAEILDFAARLGMRVVEVPVIWTNMAGSNVHPVRDSARTAWELLRHRRRVATMSHRLG